MSSQETPLERVYQEASQWVRLANTIIWSMGTLLVPVAFGFVGLALNRISGADFSQKGKAVLGVGSVFLFSFWVYASRIYKLSTDIARKVLIEIEAKWVVAEKMSLYKLQEPILNKRVELFSFELKYGFFPWEFRARSAPVTSSPPASTKRRYLHLPYGLFPLQLVTLVALVLVWVLILSVKL